MKGVPRWAAAALVASLLLNVIGLAVVIREAHNHGGVDWITQKLGLKDPPAPDYPALGRARFADLPRSPGDVVVMGDSQVQNAPLADLVTDVRQRGIGGETIDDVASWVDDVLKPSPNRIVLLVGTNDILRGHSVQRFAEDYTALLDGIAAKAPDTRRVVLSVPPLGAEHHADVDTYDDALKRVAARAGARYVDIYSALAGSDGALRPEFSADGTHLSAQGYARIAPLLRAAAG